MGFVPVKFRRIYFRDKGLRDAPRILSRNMRGGLEGVGKRLEASAISRMRKDTGKSQKSLTRVVSGRDLNLKLVVYSTLIQAMVDAYGLRRGVFPNFGVNSPLYAWVRRRQSGLPNKAVNTSIRPAGPAKYKAKPKVKRVKKVTQIGQAGITQHRARTRAKNLDARRMTFLIARAIFRRGIAATRWHTKALEANQQRIITDMQNALLRAVREINRP